MREKVLELVERHCATLRFEADALSDAFRRVETSRDPQALTALIAAAHKLKGSSGSIGFKQISDQAQIIEHLAKDSEKRQLSSPEMDQWHKGQAELQSLIAKITPHQSSLYTRFL